MSRHLLAQRLPLATARAALALLPTAAVADAVTDWNTIGTNATAGPPLPQNRKPTRFDMVLATGRPTHSAIIAACCALRPPETRCSRTSRGDAETRHRRT